MGTNPVPVVNINFLRTVNYYYYLFFELSQYSFSAFIQLRSHLSPSIKIGFIFTLAQCRNYCVRKSRRDPVSSLFSARSATLCIKLFTMIQFVFCLFKFQLDEESFCLHVVAVNSPGLFYSFI